MDSQALCTVHQDLRKAYLDFFRAPGVFGYYRLSCTMFAPLESENELGRTAAILAADDPGLLTKKLAAVEDWEKAPRPGCYRRSAGGSRASVEKC